MNKPAPSVIKTEEAEISYHDIGSGPPLLMLHGGGPGSTGWGNYFRNIAGLKGHFRLLIPDMPLYGDSRLIQDSGADFQILAARTMANFLAALGLEKAHVFGNSMGGGVSLRLAMAYPERVDRLVLMGPYVRNFGTNYMTAESEGDEITSNYYPDATLPKFRRIAHKIVFDPSAIPDFEQIIEERFKITLDPDVRANYARMSSRRPDPDPRPITEKLSTVAHKTLLFWGKEDKFCNLEVAFQFLSVLRNAELVVFRETGHWVQMERVEEFTRHVKAFLS